MADRIAILFQGKPPDRRRFSEEMAWMSRLAREKNKFCPKSLRREVISENFEKLSPIASTTQDIEVADPKIHACSLAQSPICALVTYGRTALILSSEVSIAITS